MLRNQVIRSTFFGKAWNGFGSIYLQENVGQNSVYRVDFCLKNAIITYRYGIISVNLHTFNAVWRTGRLTISTGREKKKDILIQICCVAVYLVLFVLQTFRSVRGGSSITIFGQVFEDDNINGVVNATQNLTFMIMVGVNHERGKRYAMALMTLNIIMMLRPILMFHRAAPIVGIINTILVMISVECIARQLQAREREGHTDYLTGLINRRAIVNVLEKRIQTKKPFYLLHVDLDDFKYVNNSYGHRVGDKVLQEIASRLKRFSQKGSEVGHLGGDEFILLIPTGEDLSRLIREIQETIREKIVIENGDESAELIMTACIGVVQYPKDGTDRITLTRHANIAMYHAKEQEADTSYVFNDVLAKELDRAAQIESIIRDGIARDDFYLVLQPQFETHDRRLRGFEALLRYQDSRTGESLSPGEFIPVAEKSDLIIRLDEYVLRHALDELKDMFLPNAHQFSLSVNVSAKSICRHGFAQMVEEVLDQTGFPADCLEIEITEYCLAQALEVAIANICRLKTAGIKIALDDFGTGYASLGYLSKLSIDLLKIDKSFIDGITLDEKSRNFINAVVSIGHVYNCDVISEGVEEEEQLSFLKNVGCDFIQGFLWSKPISVPDARQLAAESL